MEKTFEDTFYTNALKALGFQPRLSQAKMYEIVFNTLLTAKNLRQEEQGPISVIQASTGTGKTFAYVLAALNSLQEENKKKIIISTATVTLQEQLVNYDLPQLRASGIDFTYVLAKGRRRYVCLEKLKKVINHENEPKTDDLFSLSDTVKSMGFLYNELKDRFETGQWNGDKDELGEVISQELWQPITATHFECTNRNCASFDRCVFFKKRQGLLQADIIVANHDLVLADLQLGGGAILPMPEESVYIFDEGHHLIDKSRQSFSTTTHTNDCHRVLDALLKTLKAINKQLSGHFILDAKILEDLPVLTDGLQNDLSFTLQGLIQYFNYYNPRGYSILRFDMGLVPDEFKTLIYPLAERFQVLNTTLLSVHDKLKSLQEDGFSEVEPILQRLGYFLLQVSQHTKALSDFAYANNDPLTINIVKARWLEKSEAEHIQLISTPIVPAELLEDSLWKRCSAAIITSATLALANNFDYFLNQVGIRRTFVCQVLPYAFDYYEQAVLNIPKDRFDPTQVDCHTQELVKFIPTIFQQVNGGILVLFTSWRQLNDIRASIPEAWAKNILVQGDLGQAQLLKAHKERIDDNLPSIIFGVASFYEGVDLPNQYCRHVIITKIPFANPDDPIHRTLEEWVKNHGGNPFKDIMLPQAALKLIQATGRLIRNMDDYGEITILDQRLLTKFYGKKLLNSLPPYRRVNF